MTFVAKTGWTPPGEKEHRDLYSSLAFDVNTGIQTPKTTQIYFFEDSRLIYFESALDITPKIKVTGGNRVILDPSTPFVVTCETLPDSADIDSATVGLYMADTNAELLAPVPMQFVTQGKKLQASISTTKVSLNQGCFGYIKVTATSASNGSVTQTQEVYFGNPVAPGNIGGSDLYTLTRTSNAVAYPANFTLYRMFNDGVAAKYGLDIKNILLKVYNEDGTPASDVTLVNVGVHPTDARLVTYNLRYSVPPITDYTPSKLDQIRKLRFFGYLEGCKLPDTPATVVSYQGASIVYTYTVKAQPVKYTVSASVSNSSPTIMTQITATAKIFADGIEIDHDKYPAGGLDLSWRLSPVIQKNPSIITNTLNLDRVTYTESSNVLTSEREFRSAYKKGIPQIKIYFGEGSIGFWRLRGGAYNAVGVTSIDINVISSCACNVESTCNPNSLCNPNNYDMCTPYCVVNATGCNPHNACPGHIVCKVNAPTGNCNPHNLTCSSDNCSYNCPAHTPNTPEPWICGFDMGQCSLDDIGGSICVIDPACVRNCTFDTTNRLAVKNPACKKDENNCVFHCVYNCNPDKYAPIPCNTNCKVDSKNLPASPPCVNNMPNYYCLEDRLCPSHVATVLCPNNTVCRTEPACNMHCLGDAAKALPYCTDTRYTLPRRF